MYFRLDHGKPAAHHNIDNITLLMRLVGYKAKTSNPTTPFEPPCHPQDVNILHGNSLQRMANWSSF